MSLPNVAIPSRDHHEIHRAMYRAQLLARIADREWRASFCHATDAEIRAELARMKAIFKKPNFYFMCETGNH